MGRPVVNGSPSSGDLEEQLRRLQAGEALPHQTEELGNDEDAQPSASGRSDPVRVPGTLRAPGGSERRQAQHRIASLVDRERSSLVALGTSPVSSPKLASPRVSVSGFDVGEGSRQRESNLSRTPSSNGLGLLTRTLSRDLISSEQQAAATLSQSAGSSASSAAYVESVPEETPQQPAAREDDREDDVTEARGVLVPAGRANDDAIGVIRVSVATTPVPIPASHVARDNQLQLQVHERRDSLTGAAQLPSPSMSPLNPLSRASFSSSLSVSSIPSPTRGPCPPSPSRSWGNRSPGELSRQLLGTFEQTIMIGSAFLPAAPSSLITFCFALLWSVA